VHTRELVLRSSRSTRQICECNPIFILIYIYFGIIWFSYEFIVLLYVVDCIIIDYCFHDLMMHFMNLTVISYFSWTRGSYMNLVICENLRIMCKIIKVLKQFYKYLERRVFYATYSLEWVLVLLSITCTELIMIMIDFARFMYLAILYPTCRRGREMMRCLPQRFPGRWKGWEEFLPSPACDVVRTLRVTWHRLRGCGTGLDLLLSFIWFVMLIWTSRDRGLIYSFCDDIFFSVMIYFV